jgi:glycine/D-amino acid oxidase-like deaminating enzyme/nitrite reductase/ring-hydroxylating ferredoxin subunit
MPTLHAGETLSYWMDSQTLPSCKRLTRDLDTEVCIVGGGIAGLTTAYLLMKEGRRVCLLESFALATGQTGKTSAHLTTALDERYYKIEKYHGVTNSWLAAQSHWMALKKVEEIILRENIDCELEKIDGYFVAATPDDEIVILKESSAAQRAGLNDVDFLENSPLPSFESHCSLRFPQQLQLHPLKYLNALCELLSKGGVEIYTQAHVTKIQGGEIAQVQTKEGFTVRCQSIVIATNTPINDRMTIHTKQAPYRSYVLGFQIPRKSIKKALYWDTLDPYHYIRMTSGGEDSPYDLLIVGGEDHKTGQEEHPEHRFKRLEEWTRTHFPMALNLVYRWSGQVMEPVDGLAYMGRNPMDHDNVYIITGTSGNGLTYGTIGAMIITDQIMGRKNPWEKVYQPSRKNWHALGEFIKENVNVAAQYGDWFSEHSSDLDGLPRGEGKVIRQGLGLTAVYKNEWGHIEYMSAACPHLEGVVSWNTVEKSWDCPCHGSRFDCHGKVIEGPTTKDLQKLDVVAKTPLTLDLLTGPQDLA